MQNETERDINPENFGTDLGETRPQYTIRNNDDATRAIMAGLEWLIRSTAQKTIEEVLTTIVKDRP